MGHLEAVKVLVEKGGADFNKRNSFGRSPVDEAFDRRQTPCFDYLAERQAVPGKKAMEDAELENSKPMEKDEDDGEKEGEEKVDKEGEKKDVDDKKKE
jgi:ankyrin repeat protein